MAGKIHDTIYIRDLVFEAILGVLPAERVTPQPVCININVQVNTQAAAVSQNLEDSLDYAQLATAIQAHTVQAHCLLVETLAEQLAQLVLSQPHAQAVSVDVAKPSALDQAAAVGICIYRQRA